MSARIDLGWRNSTRFSLWFAGLLILLSRADADWPAWRGSEGSGVASDKDLPVRWSANENIRWKAPLPDRGNSSPIVWKDRLFVAQAIEKNGLRTLMCFHRAHGKLVWQASVTHKESEETHEDNPYCSASPVTDGERVVVWHGSAGVWCYDLKGKELWHRNLGQQKHDWGYAASPVLHGDLCFVHFGPGEGTFLIALNKKTGETAWQVDLPPVQPPQRTDGFAGRRDGYIGSWSTPILVQANNRTELVLSVPEKMRAFDPQTGKPLWECGGLNPLIYTSPIYGEGVTVAMGGFLGTTIAVRPGGAGDVTATRRLWQSVRTKNRLGSGVIANGHVFILNTDGLAECLDLATGARVWEERLRGQSAKSESWSSMVLAGDKIYILNQSGETYVLRASPKFELIAVNPLDGELTNSSLAVSHGELFIRTHKNLWCISEKQSGASAQ
jgi:outer membrane protein assembly factor BamB